MEDTNIEETVMPEASVVDEQVKTWNLQSCKMVEVFFKELATLSAQDIYDIAGKQEGDEGSQTLLNVVNNVYAQFIQNGDNMPRVFFDSYERTVDQFVHTVKLNIKGKNEQNMEILLAKAVGKPSTEMSYSDIVKASQVPEVEKPVVEEPVVEEVKE